MIAWVVEGCKSLAIRTSQTFEGQVGLYLSFGHENLVTNAELPTEPQYWPLASVVFSHRVLPSLREMPSLPI